jgi:hypothetical protein
LEDNQIPPDARIQAQLFPEAGIPVQTSQPEFERYLEQPDVRIQAHPFPEAGLPTHPSRPEFGR